MSPEQMKKRLTAAFPNGEVEVRDLTGTEDHYEVVVAASLFTGLSRMEQHQKVMAAFHVELKSGEVHALSIKTSIKNDAP